MPYKEKFLYSWPPGVKPVHFHQWIDALPEEEKLRARQAVERQLAIRQQYVDDGKMTVTTVGSDGSYTWKDREAWQQNKPSDQEWMQFWDRYIAETQTIFTRVQEEI